MKLLDASLPPKYPFKVVEKSREQQHQICTVIFLCTDLVLLQSTCTIYGTIYHEPRCARVFWLSDGAEHRHRPHEQKTSPRK